MQKKMRAEQLADIHKFGKIGYIITTVFLAASIGLFVLVAVLLFTAHRDYQALDRLEYTSDVGMQTVIDGEFEKEQLKDLPFSVTLVGVDILGTDLEHVDHEIRDGKTVLSYANSETKTVNVPSLLNYLLFPLAAAGLLILNVLLFRRIFRRLRDDKTPFTMGMVNQLRHFAFSLIPWIFIGSFNDLIKNRLLLQEALTLNIDLVPLTLIGIIFVLVKIFEYGLDLQGEVDDIV